MEGSYEELHNGETTDPGLQLIRYSPFQPYTKFSSPWFNLRVFYVRISKFQVADSTSEFLTLNHIPLSPDTLLEVNGVRSCSYSDGVSLLLRRDRVDKVSEEATFVSTDSIRLTGSVKFEVFDKEDLVLQGSLDMSYENNGSVRESKNNNKRWSMNCESEIGAGSAFAKGIHIAGPELLCPTIEVYVAGSFYENPIVLTKTLQLSIRRKQSRKCVLDAIPENDTAEECNNGRTSLQRDLQVAECVNYKQENEEEDEEYYNSRNMKWGRTGYLLEEEEEEEDGELSWFNAGVRVGVGIGLGICLGIGVGVGLLVRSYKATTRNFKRSLI